MGLFAKEKDIFLKIVNSILIIGMVFSVLIMVATGIKIINKEQVLSYEEYAKDVCTIDKLEYECTDENCIKELDTERKKTCTTYYLQDKKEKEKINKSNNDNFLISLCTTIILYISMHLLNKKHK
jgi:hypothetical protein